MGCIPSMGAVVYTSVPSHQCMQLNKHLCCFSHRMYSWYQKLSQCANWPIGNTSHGPKKPTQIAYLSLSLKWGGVNMYGPCLTLMGELFDEWVVWSIKWRYNWDTVTWSESQKTNISDLQCVVDKNLCSLILSRVWASLSVVVGVLSSDSAGRSERYKLSQVAIYLSVNCRNLSVRNSIHPNIFPVDVKVLEC